MQRTLVILKPEALERHIVGSVLKWWDDAGFDLIACKVATEPPERWAEHYAEVLERIPEEAGEALCSRMARGPCMFLIYQGVDCIARTRFFLGATKPEEAMEGTIRHTHGTSREFNVAHASDAVESAKREIALWFPEHA